MQKTRDRRVTDPTYIEYQRNRQAELTEEQCQRDAAAAQDPVTMAQTAMTQTALATRDAIRTQRLSQDFLPGERINGRKINEDVAISNFKLFATTQPGFKKDIHGRQLLDMMEFQDLAPLVENYKALFALMTEYAVFVEPERVSASATEGVAEPVLTPSQQAERNYIRRRTDLVVHDPVTGRNFTEFDLEHEVDSKTELRLRRLMEGRIGNERYAEFLNIKDWQAKLQAETAAKAAAEEMQQHREEN